MLILDRALFPQRPENFIPVSSHHVIYRPILGSPEQFVVGVLCSGEAGHHVERANALEKLTGLYGDRSTGVLTAIEIGLDVLEEAAARSDFIQADFKSAVWGMALGEVSFTEGPSLEAVARAWLSAHSSLFTLNPCV